MSSLGKKRTKKNGGRAATASVVSEPPQRVGTHANEGAPADRTKGPPHQERPKPRPPPTSHQDLADTTRTPTIHTPATEEERGAAGPAEQRAVTLELLPAASLGPFHLGMGVTTAIERISDEYESFARMQIVYDEAALPTSDILLQIPGLGICLRFEPVNQSLRRIDFWPSQHLTVMYKGRVVMEPGSTAQFEAIRHLFGPCGGEFDRVSKVYLLRYPGVSLGFGGPAKMLGQWTAGGEVDLQKNGRFPDGTPATLCCGALVIGVDLKAGPPAGAQLERVRTVPGSGLVFENGRRASFGDTCQEIVSTFGPPCSTFRPVDSAWIGGARESSGVFFNYRRLGIDMYFDPRRHRAVKFVLHSNVPGHFDFGVYAKCNFACEISATPLTKGSVDAHAEAMLRSCIDHQPGRVASRADIPPGAASPMDDPTDDSFNTISDNLSNGWDSGSDESLPAGTPPSRRARSGLGGKAAPVSAKSGSSMLVTPETKWEQVLRLFKMDAPVTMQPPPAPNTVNPFGVTHLNNNGPFVFETVPRTGRIATVTFVESPT